MTNTSLALLVAELLRESIFQIKPIIPLQIWSDSAKLRYSRKTGGVQMKRQQQHCQYLSKTFSYCWHPVQVLSAKDPEKFKILVHKKHMISFCPFSFQNFKEGARYKKTCNFQQSFFNKQIMFKRNLEFCNKNQLAFCGEISTICSNWRRGEEGKILFCGFCNFSQIICP